MVRRKCLCIWRDSLSAHSDLKYANLRALAEKTYLKIAFKKFKSKKGETAVTDKSLTNEDIDEECDRKFCHQDRCYIEEIDKFMKETGLNLKAFPPTKGDGNCWFRAVSDQVVIQNIPNKAKNHRALRLEVCDHVKMLPEDIRETTIAIVFNGKKRGLSEMVARQRKAGQWVDNTGIMVLTTAHYLARNIHLYSYRSETRDNTRPYSLTKIEAGPGADKCPPVPVQCSFMTSPTRPWILPIRRRIAIISDIST